MKKMVCTILLLSSFSAAQAAPLALENYMEQVRHIHDGIRSAQTTIDASQAKQDETLLLVRPQVFGQYQYGKDEKPRTSVAAQGKTMTSSTYSFGVQDQTTFGLTGKLSYNVMSMDVEGASPLYVPVSKYYTAAPSLELRQSLWRNFLGRETRATVDMGQSSQRATQYAKEFEVKGTMVQAEAAYWQLSLARETVRIQKEALDRTQKIRDWNARRVAMDLADRVDLLQAEAGLQMKRLDLKSAMDDETAAARAFNAFRGMETEDVSESLSPITEEQLKLPAGFLKASKRNDVKAAEEQLAISKSASLLGQEKTRPSLDLFASASLNGLDQKVGDATSDSTKSDNPAYAVGISLTAPLDWGTTGSVRDGYTKDVIAAEYSLKRKTFETEKTWLDSERALADARERLDLAKRMEQLQRDKLNYERGRLFKGKTVTYQVLQFEIDYSSSQLLRIREEAKMISILTSLKLYQE